MDTSNVRRIRRMLGLSQAEFGALIGVTAGNVSHYERAAQEVPPGVARKMIAAASDLGCAITFDDIYWKENNGG